MSTILNCLTTEQFDLIIAAYGTIHNWVEQVANGTVVVDIML